MQGFFLGNNLGTQAYLGWGPFSHIDSIILGQSIMFYHFSGKHMDQCESTWTWANLQEATKRNNGSVNYSQPLIDDPEGYPANTAAYFSCGAGYILSGPSSITCNPDGQGWNQFPPTCITGIEMVQYFLGICKNQNIW